MNAHAHRIASTAALSVLSLKMPADPQDRVAHTVAAGGAGWLFALLPDYLEPATSPNHRQFFHSIVMVVILGGVTYKLYRWQPETPEQKLLRWLGLAAAGAYLVHLALDATTRKSLPLIGMR